jgi:hypothetical protein
MVSICLICFLHAKYPNNTGNVTNEIINDILRLVDTTKGKGFINSPTIPLNPKYIGKNITMVVSVPNITGLA